MDVLGSLGNFYVVLLFLFLIGGSGAIALNLSRSFWEKSEKFLDKRGGILMNKWIKLAITSFAGILIASFALGITNTLSAGGADSAHSSHGAAQTPAGQMSGSHGNTGQKNYGQIGQNPVGGSYDAALYQLQVNIMRLQQQLWQQQQMLQNMQYQAGQQMNPWGMAPYGGPMYGPNMGNMAPMNGSMSNMSNMNSTSNMNNMNNTNNMGGSGSMSGGGMSMM